MSIAALGQGKGEFALSVLSKNIYKPQKGDLVVDGHKVEVKTTDGGAGRFTDQEVRPGAAFDAAARQLATYFRQYQTKPTKSGPNLDAIVNFYASIKEAPARRQEAVNMLAMVEKCIGAIFEGYDVGPIMNAFEQGNVNATKQEYAKASFNYYMAKKDDEGVLYISLTKDPIILIWFENADELAASGLRLHAGTVYITSTADIRLPYPQMEVVDSTFGANAAAAAERKATKQAKAQAKAIKQQVDKPKQAIAPKQTTQPPVQSLAQQVDLAEPEELPAIREFRTIVRQKR
jgi:hypothetical protein